MPPFKEGRELGEKGGGKVENYGKEGGRKARKGVGKKEIGGRGKWRKERREKGRRKKGEGRLYVKGKEGTALEGREKKQV